MRSILVDFLEILGNYFGSLKMRIFYWFILEQLFFPKKQLKAKDLCNQLLSFIFLQFELDKLVGENHAETI